MNPTVPIRLGGVPEHFNLPVHLALENGSFDQRGVSVRWTDYPGGTGQMTAALRNGDADVCILLTEGIIKDIIAGNPSKIVSGYVTTPLVWGIHTGTQNGLRHHADVYDRRYAISRFGSGSHLMAMVDANTHDRQIERSQFHPIQNLDGALASLTDLETDVFYWEKYTTKPYVDRGQLRRVGEFVTPWPCFVVAATNDILQREPESVIRLLRVLHDHCDLFMQGENPVPQVAERYGLQLRDAERWFHQTEWAIHGWVSDKMLRGVVHHLQTAGIVEAAAEVPDLVWRR